MKGKEWKIWRISDIMYEFSDEDFSRIETCSKEGYINPYPANVENRVSS